MPSSPRPPSDSPRPRWRRRQILLNPWPYFRVQRANRVFIDLVVCSLAWAIWFASCSSGWFCHHHYNFGDFRSESIVDFGWSDVEAEHSNIFKIRNVHFYGRKCIGLVAIHRSGSSVSQHLDPLASPRRINWKSHMHTNCIKNVAWYNARASSVDAGYLASIGRMHNRINGCAELHRTSTTHSHKRARSRAQNTIYRFTRST